MPYVIYTILMLPGITFSLHINLSRLVLEYGVLWFISPTVVFLKIIHLQILLEIILISQFYQFTPPYGYAFLKSIKSSDGGLD